MDKLKIESYGQILEGELKGWYIFIQDDLENTGGYLILFNASLESTDLRGFDAWVENRQSLDEYFRETKWKIQWLDDKPNQP